MATTNKELAAQIAQLQEQNRVMAQMLGLSPESGTVNETERADYIEHGSDKHAVFLGLIEVLEADMEDAKRNDYILYESPVSGRTWRLEDEISPFMAFPNPDKIAALYLRQKVSSLESGKPTIPDGAPTLLMPQSGF